MKLRISQAAAAVLVATGLFTSGLRAASGPAGIPFENDASFTVVLSNTNPNKVIIDGELITRISGPAGAYDSNTTATEDGALIFSPLTAQNFTVFLETAKGASLSINVQPKPVTGRTVRFTPLSPPTRKNDDAKAWEESQSYEKTLVAVSRSILQGNIPDEFTEYPVTRMATYSPDISAQLTPERQYVGSHLRIVRYRMKNPGYITMNLRERDFYKKGVRAVMLSTHQLYAGGEGYAWVIFSDGVN